MPYTTIEQTPLEIDLTLQARTTGWTVDGTIATHEICNDGSIYLIGGSIVSGQNYEVSFRVLSISGGTGVRPYLGTAPGTNRTTAGFFTETITATGVDPEFRFYSDSDCQIEVFNIRNTLQSTDLKQQNTPVWSEKINKWPSFYTYTTDCAFSIFTKLFTFKQGRAWVHRPNSGSRNSFFGTQYQTIINFPFNQHSSNVNTFESISIQSNMLMITTTDGITTSLEQLSELIAGDFTKATLVSGATTVTVNTAEGVYSAPFMRDKNIDIVNGDVLKGNWFTVELITTDTTALRLFSVAVHSEKSFIGVR